MIIITSKDSDSELEKKVLNVLERENIDARELCLSSREELVFPSLIIDGKSKRVLADDEEITLTRNEFNLLLFLACNEGITFSKEELLHTIWGADSENTEKVVANTISNLRKKLGFGSKSAAYIRTARDGYVFIASKSHQKSSLFFESVTL